VNIHGRLIGINVAIYAEAQGIGFAIPVDRVRDVLKGLFNYRLVKKTYIGIKVRDVAPGETAALKLRDASGALITDVEKDSPAAKVGLRAGDVIRAVDARPVADSLQFFKRMLAKSVGQEVKLQVARNGATVASRVVVAAVPRPSGAQLAARKLGLSLQPMTRELARTLGLRRPVGLLVTAVEEGGPGNAAGLARGDVVLRFGQMTINTLEQLAIVLEQISEQRIALLLVRRGSLYRARLTTR
jgi:serine protease Do